VILVTFNYDRLLELALDTFGVRISNISDYIKNKQFNVFKLHGSVDWGRIVDEQVIESELYNNWMIANELINKSNDFVASDKYVLSGNIPPKIEGKFALYPAIAIPVETKKDFECPNSHLDALSSHMRNVTKIITIGWRAREQHFLKLMNKSFSNRVSIHAISGDRNSAEDTLAQFTRADIDIDGMALDGGFTDYARSREAEIFLAS
jgi:SIR2-like domain